MKEIPVTNNTGANLHLAGKVLRPGDTRMIDERIVPEHLKTRSETKAPEQETTDPLQELLSGTVDSVKAGIPDLSIEDLDRLEVLEKDGHKRKGVLEAITADRLRRAAA